MSLDLKEELAFFFCVITFTLTLSVLSEYIAFGEGL